MIATRNPGSAIITSTTRPIAESNRPPRYPAIIPSTVPIPAPIATNSTAATSDTRDAVDQPAQLVATEVVGAQPVLGRRRLQPEQQVLVVGVVGREQRGEDRHAHDEHHDHEAEHRRRVADQPAQHPTAARCGRAGLGPLRLEVDLGREDVGDPGHTLQLRVEVAVGGVHQHVHHHDEDRRDGQDAQDDRHILADGALLREQTEPGQHEDRLDDHRTAQQRRNAEPEDRHHRHRRVLEGVLEQQARPGETLGPGREQVVASFLRHQRGLELEGDRRRRAQRERDRRQDEVPQPLVRPLFEAAGRTRSSGRSGSSPRGSR